MSDPYKVLGVERDASDDEIKKAYRAMSKKYHPDANINNPNKDKAEEMFKLVQEAYQQIIYERQHPYASAGSQSYGNTNTGSNTTYAGGSGYNGQFYTSWEDFFNDFFAGAYGGQYQQQYNPTMNSDYQRYMNVEDHSALWFYYSAIANAGLGNHAQALEYATTAARMEPNNYSYQNLVTQLSRGSNMYQQRETNYVQPYNSGGWCLRLCLLNMFLNLFCGGRFFCC